MIKDPKVKANIKKIAYVLGISAAAVILFFSGAAIKKEIESNKAFGYTNKEIISLLNKANKQKYGSYRLEFTTSGVLIDFQSHQIQQAWYGRMINIGLKDFNDANKDLVDNVNPAAKPFAIKNVNDLIGDKFDVEIGENKTSSEIISGKEFMEIAKVNNIFKYNKPAEVIDKNGVYCKMEIVKNIDGKDTIVGYNYYKVISIGSGADKTFVLEDVLAPGKNSAVFFVNIPLKDASGKLVLKNGKVQYSDEYRMYVVELKNVTAVDQKITKTSFKTTSIGGVTYTSGKSISSGGNEPTPPTPPTPPEPVKYNGATSGLFDMIEDANQELQPQK